MSFSGTRRLGMRGTGDLTATHVAKVCRERSPSFGMGQVLCVLKNGLHQDWAGPAQNRAPDQEGEES